MNALPPPQRHPPMRPATNEFEKVSAAVTSLIKNRDTAQFAKELTASADDWKAMASTNLPDAAETLKSFTSNTEDNRRQLEASAKAFLEKADSLHLDFSKGELHPEVMHQQFLASVHYPILEADGENMPFTRKVEIVLHPDAYTNNPDAGDFKVVLHRLNKFPGGWRCAGGIQWASFPANVVDEKTLHEMVILEKAANFHGITDKDDPALLRLGQALAQFVRSGDTNAYAKDSLPTADQMWNQMQAQNGNGPSRKEMDGMFARRNREQIEAAEKMIAQSQAQGIDLKGAEIQVEAAELKRLQTAGGPVSLDGLRGDGLKVKMTVKSDAKSKTGTPLSGDYVLAVDEVQRFGGAWTVGGNIHWDQIPPGVLDEKASAAMELENYVAEHGSLPPGTAVPEIEFTTLEGGKKMKLSDLRGKVVVLDFWATWCGPCQQPMADLQKLRDAHSNWGDKVAIVPLSIDDTLDVVRKHVDKRAWTNTFNVWAGDGGWQSTPAKEFRVRGVPTTYIIDPQGKVVIAGHPASMPIADKVDTLVSGKTD